MTQDVDENKIEAETAATVMKRSGSQMLYTPVKHHLATMGRVYNAQHPMRLRRARSSHEQRRGTDVVKSGEQMPSMWNESATMTELLNDGNLHASTEVG